MYKTYIQRVSAVEWRCGETAVDLTVRTNKNQSPGQWLEDAFSYKSDDQ